MINIIAVVEALPAALNRIISREHDRQRTPQAQAPGPGSVVLPQVVEGPRNPSEAPKPFE